MDDAISTLVERVENALIDDPRTEGYDIGVVDEGGVITLTGIVDSEKTGHTADEIASSQAGGIENEKDRY